MVPSSPVFGLIMWRAICESPIGFHQAREVMISPFEVSLQTMSCRLAYESDSDVGVKDEAGPSAAAYQLVWKPVKALGVRRMSWIRSGGMCWRTP